MNLETPLTIRSMIEPVIKRNGGWVNTHAHADRSFTLSPDVLHMRKTCTLQQKWDALDKLKSESTEEDFYRRFCQFFELMISQTLRADRRIEKPYSFMPPLLTKAEFTRLLAGRKTSFFVSINTSRPSFYL